MACLEGVPWHKRINKIKFTFGINNKIFFILFIIFFKKEKIWNFLTWHMCHIGKFLKWHMWHVRKFLTWYMCHVRKFPTWHICHVRKLQFFFSFLKKKIEKIIANYTLVKSPRLSQAQLGSLPSVWCIGPEFILLGWVRMGLP